jgi:ppGpp synthetase/RelA/SpoT-type nucleotidyltranferase
VSALEEARDRWVTDKAAFDEYGAMLAERLRETCRHAGILVEVANRTKAIDQVLRKLIRRPEYSYDTLPDLVGVRAVLRFRYEIPRVISLANDMFQCSEPDDKSVRLAEEGVGYLSVHVDATLRERDGNAATFPPGRFRAEIQVRTLAQHLWAEMAHDTFYKTDEVTFSDELKRRINLMSGLLEIADNEFQRLDREVAEVPDISDVRLLKALEAEYYRFTAMRGDPDLSLDVIKLLRPLYSEERHSIPVMIHEFVNDRIETIQHVFDQQTKIPIDRSAFFFQPEVLMLYERLEHDPLSVRVAWQNAFPDTELERVAHAFGISFD